MKHHGKVENCRKSRSDQCYICGLSTKDPYFQVYSSVDERSAAYRLVAWLPSQANLLLSWIGATASLTIIFRVLRKRIIESFRYWRSLVLSILDASGTCSLRSLIVQMSSMTSANWVCNVLQCIAWMIVGLAKHHWMCFAWTIRQCNGPVHINLVTTYSDNFDEKSLPAVRYVDRVILGWAAIVMGKDYICAGVHPAGIGLTAAVDRFCEKYGAVVILDHTSNYDGRYAIPAWSLSSPEVLQWC